MIAGGIGVEEDGSESTSTTKLVSGVTRQWKDSGHTFVAHRVTCIVQDGCSIFFTKTASFFLHLHCHRRLAAVFATMAVGVQAVLFTDYDIPTANGKSKEHVLSGTQAKFRNLWNIYVLGGSPSSSSSSQATAAASNQRNDGDKKIAE